MKSILLLFCFLLPASHCFSQAQAGAGPALTAEYVDEDTVNGAVIVANYYPIEGNIENKASAAYVTEHPTRSDIQQFAVTAPAYGFYIIRNEAILYSVRFISGTPAQWSITNAVTGKEALYPSAITGTIAESRVQEMLRHRAAPIGSITGSDFELNGKKLGIIAQRAVANELIVIVKQHHLTEGDTTGPKIHSAGHTVVRVLSASRNWGKLDFFTPIKGSKHRRTMVSRGNYYSNYQIALHKWGKGCLDYGVGTVDEAYDIYATLKGGQLNENERDYIKLGFMQEVMK